MGQVSSRVRTYSGTPTLYEKRRFGTPISRGVSGSRAVKDPVHVQRHLAWEPGDPLFARGNMTGTRREV